MIKRMLSAIKNAQNGIALPEVLIGIAITGVISGVMVMTLLQTDDIGTSNRNRMVSVNYVHNAGYWIQVDAKMAHTITVDGSDSGLPLTLNWIEWDNTTHQVTYSLEDGNLQRAHSFNGGTPMANVIAQSVETDSDLTNCQFADGVLTFKLTTTEGNGPRSNTETRVFNYKPRSELVILDPTEDEGL